MNNINSIKSNIELDIFRNEYITTEYISWLNDYEVVKYTESRWKTHNKKLVQEYISNLGSDKLFRIKYMKKHIGNLRLSSVNHIHKRCEIALIIGNKNFWGMGIGKVAIELGCQYAFNIMSLNKITAGIYINNIASQKCFLSAGFHLCATLKHHYLFEDTKIDGLVFEIFNPNIEKNL